MIDLIAGVFLFITFVFVGFAISCLVLSLAAIMTNLVSYDFFFFTHSNGNGFLKKPRTSQGIPKERFRICGKNIDNIGQKTTMTKVQIGMLSFLWMITHFVSQTVNTFIVI